MSPEPDVGEFGGLLDDGRVLDDLFSAAYEELRRLAPRVRQDDPKATLSPTALVNEARLKLESSTWVARTFQAHLKRIATRAMRQMLIEAARRWRRPLLTFGQTIPARTALAADQWVQRDGRGLSRTRGSSRARATRISRVGLPRR